MADERNQNEREEPIIRDKRRIDPETGKVRHPEAESGASAPGPAGDGWGPGESDAESVDGDDYAAQEKAAGIDGAKLESEADAADAAADAREASVDADRAVDEGGLLTDDDLSILTGRTTSDQVAAERLQDLQRVTAEYANYRRRTEANREIERDRAVGETVKGLLPVLDDLDRAEKHGDLPEGSAFSTIAAKLRAGVQRLGVAAYGQVGEVFDPQRHEAIFQQPSPDVTEPTVLDVVETGYTVGSTQLRVAKVVVAVPEKS